MDAALEQSVPTFKSSTCCCCIVAAVSSSVTALVSCRTCQPSRGGHTTLASVPVVAAGMAQHSTHLRIRLALAFCKLREAFFFVPCLLLGCVLGVLQFPLKRRLFVSRTQPQRQPQARPQAQSQTQPHPNAHPPTHKKPPHTTVRETQRGDHKCLFLKRTMSAL